MGLTIKKTRADSSILVNSQELDRISQARKNLEDVTTLAQYASHYCDLGWAPVALDALTGTDLKVDFSQAQSMWLNQLMDLALRKIRVCLAIRLEAQAPLFVLRVNLAFGKNYLDSLGDWRSSCIAQAGDIWEHHFLVLPQLWSLSPGLPPDDADSPLSVLGTGSMLVVPPSLEPSCQKSWRWLQPPWEQPPGQPAPGLLLLLAEGGYIYRQPLLAEEDLPTWEEIFPLIANAHTMLQALLTPVANSEVYYGNIVNAALQAGFRDARLLQGLLWHAPYSVARHSPEGREQLARWAGEVQRWLSAETGSPRGESHLTGHPGTGVLPGTQSGMSATPPKEENLWDELNILASLTLELEQQVNQLEHQNLSSERTPGDSSSPESGEESENVRRDMEAVLLKNPELLESE